MKIFLTSFLSSLVLGGELYAQTPASVTPRLVVGITIDQLRYDYLEMFMPLMGDRGFARVFKEGLVYKNGEYDFSNPDLASAVASIYTGTSPSVNGIIGRQWFDRIQGKVIGCVDDKKYAGNYTMDGMSPENLETSTLADELKIATGGKGLVYTIASDADAAVLSAGRNANCAFWLSDSNGKWSSTTYYREFPGWASKYNDTKGLDLKIDSMVWTAAKSIDKYRYLTSEWQKEPFEWKFKEFHKLKYKKFKSSALVNQEINNLATECLNNSGIGTDDIPDLLLLTYNAGNFDGRSSIECAYEIQDTYVRLDKELERIISLAESKVGAGNVLFFITSTGYVNSEMKDLTKYNIPSGEFYLNRCCALLNMFFMAQYGEGNYIEGFHDNNIYINKKLLKEKQLELDRILQDASDFLITFSGVSEVYTSKQLLLEANTTEQYRRRRAYSRKRSGDIIIDILPGWSSREEDSYENNVERHNFMETPVMFWGNGVKSAKIETPVTVDMIIPTVSRILRIRSPNAAAGHPFYDVKP